LLVDVERCTKLVDAEMELSPLDGNLPLTRLSDLIRKVVETIVQLATERRDFALASLEVFKFDKQAAGVGVHRRRRIVGVRCPGGKSSAATPSIG
jgi:hypothetical protein